MIAAFVIYDNGHGMPPAALKVAMAFGGSMNFGNREGCLVVEPKTIEIIRRHFLSLVDCL